MVTRIFCRPEITVLVLVTSSVSIFICFHYTIKFLSIRRLNQQQVNELFLHLNVSISFVLQCTQFCPSQYFKSQFLQTTLISSSTSTSLLFAVFLLLSPLSSDSLSPPSVSLTHTLHVPTFFK